VVNENFDKFRQEQKEHRSEYLGGNRKQKSGLNDSEYNTQDNTDKSPGATGRDI
jgi:hypothetical protein